MYLSGQYARPKSIPALSPEDSSIGLTISSVTPGYTVDSNTISCPFFNDLEISSAAETTYDRSGSLSLVIGVGTIIKTMSLLLTASTVSFVQ
ncbi:MAG: hypothetical protein AMQ74_01119 [Candidatus Methanofastidiosum methylothiophilum]|uniref:Uncharacterized protein n=1 Tax=Candidatus Methanofastidiosum methylothiophilum TaxID=1705564 RepID=A0A150J2R2_9EURY|nr:MAG: hypothetical protein AMQ74_01119 [Candidatus Methanofastidiosum methylthiophilus]